MLLSYQANPTSVHSHHTPIFGIHSPALTWLYCHVYNILQVSIATLSQPLNLRRLSFTVLIVEFGHRISSSSVYYSTSPCIKQTIRKGKEQQSEKWTAQHSVIFIQYLEYYCIQLNVAALNTHFSFSSRLATQYQHHNITIPSRPPHLLNHRLRLHNNPSVLRWIHRYSTLLIVEYFFTFAKLSHPIFIYHHSSIIIIITAIYCLLSPFKYQRKAIELRVG